MLLTHFRSCLILCETRFFWGSKPEGEGREAGVGFAIKKDIVTKLTEMPRPVSDRIMTMRLPLRKDNFATITSVYTPTMTNPDEKGGLLQPAGKCAQWHPSYR